MKLRYLLDTNICIYIAKQNPIPVLNKFQQMAVGSIGMSLITYGELFYGAQKSHHPRQTSALLEELINLIPVLPLPILAAKRYGEIRSKLTKKGNLIGNNDLWIAAHALAMELTLVTNNCREFVRVPKLRIENWAD